MTIAAAEWGEKSEGGEATSEREKKGGRKEEGGKREEEEEEGGGGRGRRRDSLLQRKLFCPPFTFLSDPVLNGHIKARALPVKMGEGAIHFLALDFLKMVNFRAGH